MSGHWSRVVCAALDRQDPLAEFRKRFALPRGIIYLNGNSLGPMPKDAARMVKQAAMSEWREGLITSWNNAGWFDLPYRLGRLLAPVIGADGDEVVVTDATGLNLFKAVSLALSLNPERRVLVMEGSNFPTNNYMVQGLVALLGDRYEIRFAEKDALMPAIDRDVAAIVLTQAHYRTAHILDMQALTAKAHSVGALAVWDLCHSAGVLDVDLNGANADIAVGCTYKYLNGGPGSPAFIFLARRHHGKAHQPLTGWYGHEAPFAFQRDYQARTDIGQLLTGTQAILSMRACEAGLQLAAEADRKAVRNKAKRLGDLFIALLEERCGEFGFSLASPRDGDQRGGHVALLHPNGYPIMKALIAAGVMGDYRAPNLLRFGFSPLTLRYVDIWDAVERLSAIMRFETWRSPEFQTQDKVT
jgi:kynureninase